MARIIGFDDGVRLKGIQAACNVRLVPGSDHEAHIGRELFELVTQEEEYGRVDCPVSLCITDMWDLGYVLEMHKAKHQIGVL